MKQLQTPTWLMSLAIAASSLVPTNSYAGSTKQKKDIKSPQLTGDLEMSTFHDFSNKAKYFDLNITKANLKLEQTLPFGEETVAFVAGSKLSIIPVAGKGNTPFFVLTKFQLDHQNFIAGLTGSNFGDSSASADTLDGSPHGAASAKVIKLGWKDQIEEEGLSYGIAAESRVNQPVNRNKENKKFAPQYLPAIAAYAKYEQDFGYVRLGGLVRGVDRYTKNIKIYYKPSWGVNLTSTLNLLPEQVSLKMGGVYGVGIGSYLSSSDAAGKVEEIAYLKKDKHGELVLLGMLGAHLGVEYCWRPDLHSTFAYGVLSATNNKDRKKYIERSRPQKDAYKQSHYASANLTYHPMENLMMGVEYVFDKLRTLAKESHKAKHRIQLAAGLKF